MADKKIVSFPITIGEVRLMFTKVGDDWVCKLADEFMQDLEDAVSGKMPKERVKWVELPDVGLSNGPDLS
jgi:hypothetical protein